MTECITPTRRRAGRARRGGKIIQRGLHPALAMPDAGERQPISTPASAPMIVRSFVSRDADAEHLPGDLREPGAERYVEMLQRVFRKHPHRCPAGMISAVSDDE